jgi:hypothetical protein
VARQLHELDVDERRHVVLVAVAEVVAAWVVLFGVYYLVPFSDSIGAVVILRLVAGLALFVAVLAWQVRKILVADLPALRAGQALGVAVPLFIVVFAALYLSVASESAGNFSEPLNHTVALYFTITVLSTVGFGDITPTTDPARILVSFQMLLDLVLLAALVRIVVVAARTGLTRQRPPS